MGSGSSSYYDDYDDYDDYPHDNRRYSRQVPGHHRSQRPVRKIEEHHVVERRHSPVGQPPSRILITERRSPPTTSSPVMHREIRVKDEIPEVVTTRRSPVQVERVVHKHDVPSERVVREVHERVEPQRLISPERLVHHRVGRERMEPGRDDRYYYDDRARPTTARYYEDRDPASWYRRERSAQREKVRQSVDKRKRHQDVRNSLYRDGSIDDNAYRSSYIRRY